MLTIPTGISIAPYLAQLALTAIARTVLESNPCEKKEAPVCFIDNLAFPSNTAEAAERKRVCLLHLCKKLGVTLNTEETKVTRQHTFLGLNFEHSTKEVTLSEKAKLKLFSDAVNIESWTLIEAVGCFSRLQYASRVLRMDLSCYYPIFKFIRRRLSPNNFSFTGHAKVWGSITHLWKQWCTDTINKVLHVDSSENRVSSAVLYTDASNKGWGATLYLHSGQWIVTAGPWSQYWQSKHINVLEAEAVFLALEAFKTALSDTLWSLRIDNTSVLGALQKTRSNSFNLNSVIGRINNHSTFKNCTSASYIESAQNPADSWSRLGHQVTPHALNS